MSRDVLLTPFRRLTAVVAVTVLRGYEGEGRQVIALAGRIGEGRFHGPGIGVQERDNNRHVLLSAHAGNISTGPSLWSAESEQIFWNAIDWGTPGTTLPPVSGLQRGDMS